MRYSKYWFETRDRIERERTRLENSPDPADRQKRPGMSLWPGKVKQYPKAWYRIVFAGQRWGGAAPIPRFDVVYHRNGCRRILPATRRWAAQPPEPPTPASFKLAQALASRLITDSLRLPNDPHTRQRLRDHRNHIHEQRRESGAAFQDGHESVAEHARGIQWAILQEIELHRRHDQLRWVIDAPVDDEASATTEQVAKLNDALLIEQKGWWNGKRRHIPRGRDTNVAAFAGFEFQELLATENDRRAKYNKPRRERKKVGRKPKGERAMTNAERQREHRERKLANETA